MTTRRPDGKPETSADTRLFDLRESGWTGPVDSDGYIDTTSYSAEVLRDLARRRGESVDW